MRRSFVAPFRHIFLGWIGTIEASWHRHGTWKPPGRTEGRTIRTNSDPHDHLASEGTGVAGTCTVATFQIRLGLISSYSWARRWRWAMIGAHGIWGCAARNASVRPRAASPMIS